MFLLDADSLSMTFQSGRSQGTKPTPVISLQNPCRYMLPYGMDPAGQRPEDGTKLITNMPLTLLNSLISSSMVVPWIPSNTHQPVTTPTLVSTTTPHCQQMSVLWWKISVTSIWYTPTATIKADIFITIHHHRNVRSIHTRWRGRAGHAALNLNTTTVVLVSGIGIVPTTVQNPLSSEKNEKSLLLFLLPLLLPCTLLVTS